VLAASAIISPTPEHLRHQIQASAPSCGSAPTPHVSRPHVVHLAYLNEMQKCWCMKAWTMHQKGQARQAQGHYCMSMIIHMNEG